MKDDLGSRLKKYEKINRQYVLPQIPVFVRIDGKAFHTFTQGFDKPFDKTLSDMFKLSALRTMQEIQQCVFGYSQSDEFTILLNGWDSSKSEMWFGGNIQKIASVTASIFSVMFERSLIQKSVLGQVSVDKMNNTLMPAYFDARVFQVPIHEVENVFLWRQFDAKRNSIQALGRSEYSHEEIAGLKTFQIVDVLKKEKGIDWEELPNIQKWGFTIRQSISYKISIERMEWRVDDNIPYFLDDREYFTKNIWNRLNETTT